MSNFRMPFSLRQILLADGVISGATGLLMALAADTLQEWLGVPAILLRYAGWSLVPFAVLVLSLAGQAAPPRPGVVTVIAMNAAWVAGSLLLLLAGGLQPSALGYAFIVGQAVAVAVLAELQYASLRGSAAVAA